MAIGNPEVAAMEENTEAESSNGKEILLASDLDEEEKVDNPEEEKVDIPEDEGTKAEASTKKKKKKSKSK